MNHIERHFATYNFNQLDHLIRKEFYFWGEILERWKNEGWDGDKSIFGYDYDENIYYSFDVIGRDFLGWTEAPLYPMVKEEIIDIKDGYEYWRLTTGEVRKYTIGGRHAIMPQFVSAPVQSRDM